MYNNRVALNSFHYLESATTTVVKFRHLPFPIFVSIISGKSYNTIMISNFIAVAVSAAVICIVTLTGLIVMVLVCVLQWKKKTQQSTPVEQVL